MNTRDKFVYEYTRREVVTNLVVGRRYNSEAIVLDMTWFDDDHVLFLMVEEDDNDRPTPFVITKLNLNALDVRNDIVRDVDLRDATINWEQYTR